MHPFVGKAQKVVDDLTRRSFRRVVFYTKWRGGVTEMNIMDRTKRLREIEKTITQGPFQDNWNSLSQYRLPDWYRDAKFGIFIHWGLYSVPAFGSEWYSRNMYIQGSREYEHHLKTYGPHKAFGYKDFIPRFKAECYNPTEWAALFAQAGAKYIIPVAEHHDGFQMYRSELSEWNAAEKGPCRDMLGELKAACEAQGLIFGASSHRMEHWFFMGHGREFDSDIHDPMQCGDFYWPAQKEADHHDLFSEPTPSREFMEDWLLRCCELVDRYQPKIIYFDWWIQHSALKPYVKKFAAYYYNRAEAWGSGCVINYKHEAFVLGCAVPDVERGQFADAKPYYWQTDTATARNSWCYTQDNDYKSARSLLCDLVDIVSKNGTLLLNVGPRADGTIGTEDQKILREIGEWMRINGEAIYGTHVWRKAAEGPTQIEDGPFTDAAEKVFTSQDFRFTMKGDKLYAICLRWPEDGKVSIAALASAGASGLPFFHGIIRRVEVLGSDGEATWVRDEKGFHVQAPFIQSDNPVVLRLTLA